METSSFDVDVVTSSPEDALRQSDFEMWFWVENFGNFSTLRSMTSIGGRVATIDRKVKPLSRGAARCN